MTTPVGTHTRVCTYICTHKHTHTHTHAHTHTHTQHIQKDSRGQSVVNSSKDVRYSTYICMLLQPLLAAPCALTPRPSQVNFLSQTIPQEETVIQLPSELRLAPVAIGCTAPPRQVRWAPPPLCYLAVDELPVIITQQHLNVVVQ